jgi:ribosomal protein S10
VIIVNLFIRTKNKNSLTQFLYFLKKNINKNFKAINLYFPKKKNKKVITLLKSPHVNKTAQEQFEIKFFSMQLKILTTQTFKFLIFLKNIKNFLFSDIQIKTNFLNISNNKILFKNILNIDNNSYRYLIKYKKFIKNEKFNDIKLSKKKMYTLNTKKYNISNKLVKHLDLYGH